MIDRFLTLMIVDNDPIFRLGLVQALGRGEIFTVIAEGDLESPGIRSIVPDPDLILLDPARGNLPDWSVCQSLRDRYPDSRIVLFTAILDRKGQLIAGEIGIVGYIPKGIALETLRTILRQIALENETYWPTPDPLTVASRPSLPSTHWLIRLGRSGLARIEGELRSIEGNLDRPRLSGFDRLFWRGRKRELLAAEWMVRQLIPLDPPDRALPPPAVEIQPVAVNELSLLSRTRPLSTSVVFEETLAVLRSPLRNRTKIPFEIDVLQDNRKRELLYLILDKIRKAVDELRFLQISPPDLGQRQRFLIAEIWEDVTRELITLHSLGEEIGSDGTIEGILSEDREGVQREILEKIPFVLDLLTYLVYEGGLVIDKVEYRSNAPETIDRAEILLQNLIHHLANGVMGVILNHFSESENTKQALFRPEFLSSREIAKIRNDLSWKYRRERYWEEPKEIFESEYRLFHYLQGEIQPIYLYAPRQAELNRLTGIRWLVSIALEARDALSPRLRAIFSVAGKGVVYLLIQVIGRGIGLIVRGILQGVGNTWQEVKSKK